MFNAIGFIIKVAFFSLAVLVIANYVKWDGRTVSDQIRTQLSHAESSEIADQVRDLTRKITEDAKEGFERKNNKSPASAAPRAPRKLVSQNDKSATDEIAPSERQKLRALIRELNASSQKKD